MTPEEKKGEILYAIGYASMCWTETPKGVFDESQANKVANNLYEKLFGSSVPTGTFKDRLIAEKQDLDDKRAKLEGFLLSEAYGKIPVVQQSLLNVQVHAMATYSQILTERIAWLENTDSEKDGLDKTPTGTIK